MFMQIAAPLLLAAAQPNASFDTLEKPDRPLPHSISPENRNFGRRRSQTGTPVFFDVRPPKRRRTLTHSFIADDPQFGHVGDHPIRFRVEA